MAVTRAPCSSSAEARPPLKKVDSMLNYASRYPDNLFVGSETTTALLREGIRREQGR